MGRREFTPSQRRDIVERSKRNGMICCEGCGRVLGAKSYEIDHIIPEGLRPEVDKRRKLTIAEGQLLGMGCCHRGPDGKTRKDVAQIAKAKRQYDAAHGLSHAAKRPIASRGFSITPKSARRADRAAERTSLAPRNLFQGDSSVR